MKVAELQQLLDQLVPLMKTAGLAESKLADLAGMVHCLDPFKEKNIADFSDFLRRTFEHYAQAGTFPEIIKPQKVKSPRGAKAPKAPKITIAEAAQKFMFLYEAAAERGFDYALVDNEIGPLEKALSAVDLRQLAQEVGLEVAKTATKLYVVAELKEKNKRPPRERRSQRTASHPFRGHGWHGKPALMVRRGNHFSRRSFIGEPPTSFPRPIRGRRL